MDLSMRLPATTYLPLDAVNEYENNPRTIPEAAIDAVADSIRKYGFRQPILIDPDGVIVTGHVRYRAAQRLELETIPTISIDDLTPEQLKAYRMVDNRVAEFSSFDFSSLTTEMLSLGDGAMDLPGFGDAEIESIRTLEFDLPQIPRGERTVEIGLGTETAEPAKGKESPEHDERFIRISFLVRKDRAREARELMKQFAEID